MRSFSYFRSLILASFVLGLAACAEVAGSGVPVTIPSVSISCNSSYCQSGGASPQLVVVYTKSSCQDIETAAYDLDAVTGSSTSVSCSSGTCTGTVSTWKNLSGDFVSSIPSGTYSLCGWLTLDGSLPGDLSGTKASRDNLNITGSSMSETLSGWFNLPAWQLLDFDFILTQI